MKNFLLLLLLICQTSFATDFYSKVRLRDTTTSTSTSTGSLRVDGGMGVAGTSFFGGAMTLTMSAGPMLTIQDGGTAGTNADPYIRFMDTSSQMGFVGFPVSNSLNMYLSNLKNGDLILGTNNTNLMTIDNGGLHTLSGSLGFGATPGTPSTAVILHGRSDQNSATRGIISNQNTGSSAYARWTVSSDSGDINLDSNSVAAGAVGSLNVDSSYTGGFEISMGGTRDFRVKTNGLTRSTWGGSSGEQTNEKPFVLAHSSTPSNPSSGYVKIYPKSDNRFYSLSSAGTESELLTTSSGVEARMNHLYNGNFDIWQRGTSTTVANGSTKYLADRWYVQNGLGTNGVITYSRVSGTSTGAKYGAQVEITTAPTASQTNATYLYQVLENFDTLPLIGKTASFQIKVKALSNVNQVALRFMYNTSEAKPNANIGSATTCNVSTGSFTTCEISSEALGTSMTNAGSLAVQIQINGVSSGNTYDINNGFVVEQAMVVIGQPPTEFKTKYQSFTEELAACQRYYEKTYDYATAPGTATTAGCINGQGSVGSFGVFGARPIHAISTRYAVRKRTNPTFTPYSPWSGLSGYIYNGTDAADYAPSSVGAGETGITVTQTNSESSDEIYMHFTADAEI